MASTGIVVSTYDWLLTAGVAIWLHDPLPLIARSTSNPVSSVALSVHVERDLWTGLQDRREVRRGVRRPAGPPVLTRDLSPARSDGEPVSWANPV